MLPKVDVPIYELELPLSKKRVKFRPFLVKEEKILLMAVESDDEKAALLAIKQIISNCCLEQDFDINKLPVVDLEYFFLNLRARSVGEVVNLQYKCNNNVKNEENKEVKCNHVVPIDINLLNIKPEMNADHSDKIQLSEKLGIVMKYPTFDNIEKADSNKGQIETIMELITECIDCVYDEDSVYYTKDVPKKEVEDFVENLSQDHFKKIQKFFDTLPKIKQNVNFKCNKCGYEENIDIEGIQNFFV